MSNQAILRITGVSRFFFATISMPNTFQEIAQIQKNTDLCKLTAKELKFPIAPLD